MEISSHQQGCLRDGALEQLAVADTVEHEC